MHIVWFFSYRLTDWILRQFLLCLSTDTQTGYCVSCLFNCKHLSTLLCMEGKRGREWRVEKGLEYSYHISGYCPFDYWCDWRIPWQIMSFQWEDGFVVLPRHFGTLNPDIVSVVDTQNVGQTQEVYIKRYGWGNLECSWPLIFFHAFILWYIL
jgi:hypothetical protein